MTKRTNKRAETHACDCISRQAAIDALKNERSDWNCDYNVPVDHCIDAIRNLPSAQPELGKNTMPEQPKMDRLGVKTGETCTDTISRQAAIGAASRGCFELRGVFQDIKGEIEALPPVTPERKKGKWIRNDNGTYSCSVCQSWIPEEQHYYARYCLYCGADMKGGKNERDHQGRQPV